MTPPLTAPVPWEAKAISLGLLAFVVAIPYLRRGDWIGWIALSTTAAVAIGIWALLIRGMALNTIRWWRNRSAARRGSGEPELTRTVGLGRIPGTGTRDPDATTDSDRADC